MTRITAFSACIGLCLSAGVAQAQFAGDDVTGSLVSGAETFFDGSATVGDGAEFRAEVFNDPGPFGNVSVDGLIDIDSGGDVTFGFENTGDISFAREGVTYDFTLSGLETTAGQQIAGFEVSSRDGVERDFSFDYSGDTLSVTFEDGFNVQAGAFNTITFTPTVVPEPMAAAAAFGVAGLLLRRRR